MLRWVSLSPRINEESLTCDRLSTLNDLLIFFSQRSNLISLMVLPVIFALVLGWAFGGGESGGPQRVRIDLIDQDQSALSATFLDKLRAANNTLGLCPMGNELVEEQDDYCRLGDDPLDLERALERVQEEQTEALIVIPAGYGQALEEFEQEDIEFYAMPWATRICPMLLSRPCRLCCKR